VKETLEKEEEAAKEEAKITEKADEESKK